MDDKPVSRQRAYQLRRIADGLCAQCGKRPLFSSYACKKCQVAMRKAKRNAKGCKPWKAGGRGRPPIEEEEEIEF